MEVTGYLQPLAALHPEVRAPWYQVNRSLGEPQSLSESNGEEKKLLSLLQLGAEQRSSSL